MISMHERILSAFVNRLNFGVFILAEDGHPFVINGAAKQFMAETKTLYTDKTGSLRICQAAADKQLKSTIRRLSNPGSTRHAQPILIRGEATAPVCVWVELLAVPDESGHMCGPEQVIVLLLIQALHQDVTSEILSSLFALTRAEARLLLALLEGRSPADYARTQKLSQNTVRNQLKSIFDKTEVRRQCDLVGLVLRLLAPLSFDDPGGREGLRVPAKATTNAA